MVSRRDPGCDERPVAALRKCVHQLWCVVIRRSTQRDRERPLFTIARGKVPEARPAASSLWVVSPSECARQIPLPEHACTRTLLSSVDALAHVQLAVNTGRRCRRLIYKLRLFHKSRNEHATSAGHGRAPFDACPSMKSWWQVKKSPWPSDAPRGGSKRQGTFSQPWSSRSSCTGKVMRRKSHAHKAALPWLHNVHMSLSAARHQHMSCYVRMLANGCECLHSRCRTAHRCLQRTL